MLVQATGGYERAVTEVCAEYELPIIIVTPIKVRQFARAQGVLAKTDKIDARLIAQFGVVMQPEVRPLPTKNIVKVRDLTARKRQLMESRTQELNRQHKAQSYMTSTHRRMIKMLVKEITWIDQQLEKEVAKIDEWQQAKEVLLSAPGLAMGLLIHYLVSYQSWANSAIGKLQRFVGLHRSTMKAAP